MALSEKRPAANRETRHTLTSNFSRRLERVEN